MRCTSTTYLCIFFLLISGLAGKAQNIPAELDNTLKTRLTNMRNLLGVKSLSAAIQFPDNSVWSYAYGISSLSPVDSAKTDYLYSIGSLTKSITAACVLQLADEGLLGLDDKVSKWLPPYPHVDSNITVRQLLRHQSGLYDVITNPAYNQATQADLDSVWTLHNLVSDYMQPPLFAAGTGWSYSNTNYAFLGLIVESVTGNKYRTEFKERLFEPLELKTILLPPYDVVNNEIAHFWAYNPATGVSADAHGFFSNWTSFRTSAGPIGGYFSTASDMAIFNRSLMRGELHSTAILNEAKVTVATNMPGGTKYGLGIMERKLNNLTGYGHGGDIGYSAFMFYFPDLDISIAVMNNDAKKISWDLAPVISNLLKAYTDYLAATPTVEPIVLADVAAYPNPFEDFVNVQVYLTQDVASARANITDVTGKMVKSVSLGTLTSGKQLLAIKDLQDLNQGVYMLQLELDGVVTGVVKLVK